MELTKNSSSVDCSNCSSNHSSSASNPTAITIPQETKAQPEAASPSSSPIFAAPSELLPFRLLRASYVLSADWRRNKDDPHSPSCWPRHQSLRTTEADAAWWRPGIDPPPVLTLFISHRWEAMEEPDESGEQLSAVRFLLRALAGVLQALLTSTAKERIAAVPSLLCHGVLQSAVLAGKLDWSLLEKEFKQSSMESDPLIFANRVLPRILLFYDYSCMPQKPRVGVEEEEFARALEGLHSLIRFKGTVLITLRKAGDDFDQRGWCVAERAVANEEPRDESRSRPLVLRTDRIGQPLTVNPSFASEARVIPILATLQSWENAQSQRSAMDIWSGSCGHEAYFEEIFKEAAPSGPVVKDWTLGAHSASVVRDLLEMQRSNLHTATAVTSSQLPLARESCFTIPQHEHPLKLYLSRYNEGYRCDVCAQSAHRDDCAYACELCGFDCHPACFFARGGIDLAPLPLPNPLRPNDRTLGEITQSQLFQEVDAIKMALITGGNIALTGSTSSSAIADVSESRHKLKLSAPVFGAQNTPSHVFMFTMFAARLIKHAHSSPNVVMDLEKLVRLQMNFCKLACSNSADALPAGLLMLRAGGGDTNIQLLLAECFQRAVRKIPLLISMRLKTEPFSTSSLAAAAINSPLPPMLSSSDLEFSFVDLSPCESSAAVLPTTAEQQHKM